MYFNLILVLNVFLFLLFLFASTLSALHFSYEPKFIIVNTGIPKRFHAHNDTDLWDRESMQINWKSRHGRIRTHGPTLVAFEALVVLYYCAVHTVLYRTALYCTVLHCTVPYCTVRYYCCCTTVRHCTILYNNTTAHASMIPPAYVSFDYPCCLRAPFQLASPPGFHVTHIPMGNHVYTYMVRYNTTARMIDDVHITSFTWNRARSHEAVIYNHTLDNTYFNRLLCMQLIQDTVYQLELSRQLISEVVY